jgi:hypothetical protein
MDEFDGVKTIELKQYELCYLNPDNPSKKEVCQSHDPIDYDYRLEVSLSRKGNNKYVEFEHKLSSGNELQVVKIKLDDGKILRFNNLYGSSYTGWLLKVNLKPTDIQELKKSPIDLIRFEVVGDKENTVDGVWNFKITQDSKNYFIKHLDCLN